MIKQTKNSDATKSKFKKPFLYALGMILIVLGIFYALIELPMEQRFSVVDKEMEKVRQEVIKPVGGTEIERKGDKFTSELPYKRGDNWINGCSIDVHCPVISRTWQVTIKKGSEHEFVTQALAKMGYRITLDSCLNLDSGPNCGISGKKENLDISIHINTESNNTTREVRIMLNYYWEKE